MRKRNGNIKNENDNRKYRRKLSIRKKVSGTTEIPRLSVTKSNRHLFLQVIDDTKSKTLFSVQTFGKNGAKDFNDLTNRLATKLKENSISRLVFDRSGNKYTGVLKSLADNIREQGIRI